MANSGEAATKASRSAFASLYVRRSAAQYVWAAVLVGGELVGVAAGDAVEAVVEVVLVEEVGGSVEVVVDEVVDDGVGEEVVRTVPAPAILI